MSTDITDGMEATTVEGSTVKFSIKDGMVYVNDAKVIQPDIITSNGVIHVIDAVLIPPDLGSSTETTAAAGLSASLNGAGATFPKPLYVEWIGEFQMVNPGVSINYQGIGSGGGIEQFTQLTVDFGASDAPMKDEEIAAAEAASGAKVLHIPTVFGSVVLAYNAPGVAELKLDSDTVAAIFLGTITKWNDAKIAALNSGVTLPDKAIQVVHRSDSSGTTNIFTSYLTSANQEWADKVGKGKEVQWPVGVGGQGNDGVAAVIQQQEGSHRLR